MIWVSCLNDNDDEVRERAYFYFKAFNNEGAASIIFAPKTLNIENLQLLIQAQKEFLLKSNDIVGDIRNLINDPSTLEKISKKIESVTKNIKSQEKKFPTQDNKKEEEKILKDDIYFDYKTTSFFKKLGLPRNCTLNQVLKNII